jgi:sugar lactone lactonase YvrE
VCPLLVLGTAGALAAQATPAAPDLAHLLTPDGRGRIVNRAVAPVPDGPAGAVRLDERAGQGLAWIRGVRFSTGVIEVDVRGKDAFQRSFVGIAFRGASDSRYEVVYLRPFNYRAADPVRRSHAMQYALHPELTWSALRRERPGVFESAAGSGLDPGQWVRLRIDVQEDRVRAFVGDSVSPALDVPRLGTVREGVVGLWVGEGSGGDFANLRIEPRPAVSEAPFPVRPEVFIDRFQAAEGITFNGEGRLFLGADSGVWLVEPDGAARRIADVHLHLGQAGIGPRDILAADFGPTNVFQDGPNDDGIVWRITPEGRKTVAATGIADPNAVLVLKDGSFLVSDDGTDKIYRVRAGAVSIWSSDVAYPNGMTLSPDGRMVYVAQIFGSLDPIVGDDRIWAFELADGDPLGAPIVVARTGEGGLDGLVADADGRIYAADNGTGKVWRFDPRSGETILIAEGMRGVASLVFGEGQFDREAIYATSTRAGGGRIWKVRVGVRGAPVPR